MKISTALDHTDNENTDVLSFASGAGFRCFTSSADFRANIETEIRRLEAA